MPPDPATVISAPMARRPAEAAVAPPDEDRVARRALDLGRRTALGVLAGDHAAADDVAQDVAIQAVRCAATLREPAALDAWLHRTAVRAALRAAKRGRRRRDVEQRHAALTPVGAVPDPSLDELATLLGGLPERQRAALTLRYAHDLDDAAIAAALGCRAGTVRALLSRGRAAVRAQLEDTSAIAPRDTQHDREDDHA
jgi:RNA polymerase sigma-70 factor (ECF subfamily)